MPTDLGFRAAAADQWTLATLREAKKSVDLPTLLTWGASEGHDVAASLGRLYARKEIVWSDDFVDLVVR